MGLPPLFEDCHYGLLIGLFWGLIVGLGVGLLYGLLWERIGEVALSVIFVGYILRWLFQQVFFHLLWLIPWNYSRFLDYATERILLRKVGNSYTFVHRLLLEYFATQADLSASSYRE